MVHTIDDVKGIHYAVNLSTLHPGEWETGLTETWNGPIALDDPTFHAMHLRFKWAQLNPTQGVYDFSAVTGILDLLVTAGKKATLVVQAGTWTPAWAIVNGGMRVDAEFQANSLYSQGIVPLAHEQRHRDNYNTMIRALGAVITADNDWNDCLVLVKSGLLVSHSAETRLIPVDAFDDGMFAEGMTEVQKEQLLCDRMCVAGYREAFALDAGLESVGVIREAFPDQLAGIAYAGGAKQFPTNGVEPGALGGDPRTNETLFTLIRNCAAAHTSMFAANLTTLTGNVRQNQKDLYADVTDAGGNVGAQIDKQELGYDDEDAPNDPVGLQAAFVEGRAIGGTFVEVHEGNMVEHADLLEAENDLLRTGL